MKHINVADQLERLEDQLQVIKWALQPPQLLSRLGGQKRPSIVTRTAGLLRNRLPQGHIFQRRLRRQWDARLRREAR